MGGHDIQLLPSYHSDYVSNPSSITTSEELNSFLRFHCTRLAKERGQEAANSRSQFSTFDDASSSHQMTTCLSDLWSLSLEQMDSDYLETQVGQQRLKLAISALVLSRNLVAGSSQAQLSVYRQIFSLLQLLHRASSFSSLNSSTLQPLTRTAVQLLANLVTQNEALQEKLWTKITNSWRMISTISSTNSSRLPEIQEVQFGDLFSRLLASPDQGTLTATQVLLLNCSKASYSRSLSLCSTLEGVRILALLLNIAEATVEEDETEEERLVNVKQESNEINQSQGERLSQKLGIIYPFLTRLFSLRLFSQMFQNILIGLTASNLNQTELSSGENSEDLTSLLPEQLTLLKLLDSYLHFKASSIEYGDRNLTSDSPQETERTKEKDLEILIEWVLKVSKRAEKIMKDSLEVGENNHSSEELENGDGEMKRLKESKLESLHKVLVLTLQCLIAICVSAEGESSKQRFEESFKSSRESEVEVKETSEKLGEGLAIEGRDLLKKLRSKENGVVEQAVALLKITSKYSPAISPFRPLKSGPAPDSHSLSTTGSAPSLPIPERAFSSDCKNNSNLNPNSNDINGGGLTYLKRDLVRLLGVLSYSPPKRYKDEDQENAKAVKDVQDRVRELGGLFDVMNLTNLDELNPYIREHAIFTLRNLLASNEESQALIAKLRPLDSNGIGKDS